MNEQPTFVVIEDNRYLIEELSDSCKELLNASQQANQAISLFATIINAAQKGSDLHFKEAVKLLPEPYQDDEATPEGEETH